MRNFWMVVLSHWCVPSARDENELCSEEYNTLLHIGNIYAFFAFITGCYFESRYDFHYDPLCWTDWYIIVDLDFSQDAYWRENGFFYVWQRVAGSASTQIKFNQVNTWSFDILFVFRVFGPHYAANLEKNCMNLNSINVLF